MKTIPTIATREIDHASAGKEIRTARDAAKMSLRRLADVLKISAPYLYDLETGRRNWTVERFDAARQAINNFTAKR